MFVVQRLAQFLHVGNGLHHLLTCTATPGVSYRTQLQVLHTNTHRATPGVSYRTQLQVLHTNTHRATPGVSYTTQLHVLHTHTQRATPGVTYTTQLQVLHTHTHTRCHRHSTQLQVSHTHTHTLTFSALLFIALMVSAASIRSLYRSLKAGSKKTCIKDTV